jgi:outer membrane protein OmpA-like peptidoglycan-associated protein
MRCLTTVILTLLLFTSIPTFSQQNQTLYFVQIATYESEVKAAYFEGIQDILERKIDDKTYRYFSGPFIEKKPADSVASLAQEKGYRYADVITIQQMASLDSSRTDSLSALDSEMDPLELLGLRKVEGGEAIQVKNVFFGFDSSYLDAASRKELDEVSDFLLENIHYIVEVRAHTDSTGNEYYNILLSERRRDAVIKYLRDKGISANRMEPHIFGETNPIANNSRGAGRTLNRRVELVVKKEN